MEGGDFGGIIKGRDELHPSFWWRMESEDVS
jgi:hypothetical protein